MAEDKAALEKAAAEKAAAEKAVAEKAAAEKAAAEKRTPVSPETGTKELDPWQRSVNETLGALTDMVTKQGKALQEWGFEEPKPKPGATSAPAAKSTKDRATEPLDKWSGP